MHDDQTAGLQRITQFTALADALAHIATRLKPVPAQTVERTAAFGRTLAEDVTLDAPMPAAALALRDGWAVEAELTVDASPYAPAPVLRAKRIEVGGKLTPEHDAVLPIDAVIARAGSVQAVAPVTAGEGVLPAGGDAPPNARTLRAGRRINRVHLALLHATGMQGVPVRIPRVRLARARADLVIDTALACIADAVHSSGAVPKADDAAQDFEPAFPDDGGDAIIVIGGSGCGRTDRVVRTLACMGELIVHGIGLVPGETAAIAIIESGRPVLVLPGRLDAALAAWHMLGRAFLQKLAGSTEPLLTAAATLTQKVASPGGIAELVPVHCDGRTATPLASGYLPAAILAQANGWILIGPESEGYPAGSEVAIRPWP